jgi:hypothetical protein
MNFIATELLVFVNIWGCMVTGAVLWMVVA